MNRSPEEDYAIVSPVSTVDALFDGLSYKRINVAVGDTSPLASEIWRAFLIAMVLALILEAAFSLPGRKAEQRALSDLAVAGGNAKQMETL